MAGCYNQEHVDQAGVGHGGYRAAFAKRLLVLVVG